MKLSLILQTNTESLFGRKSFGKKYIYCLSFPFSFLFAIRVEQPVDTKGTVQSIQETSRGIVCLFLFLLRYLIGLCSFFRSSFLPFLLFFLLRNSFFR